MFELMFSEMKELSEIRSERKWALHQKVHFVLGDLFVCNVKGLRRHKVDAKLASQNAHMNETVGRFRDPVCIIL